ncbi:hypothetical protein [Adlercreutzia sp. ZJ141]|uniref:hypothetical protein n=1 Tax=Adlercreutzia sp. ZJ141 TaxID=2709406 RepID=UPI0013EE1425|nr:hypothetical protein [Adlercreutzia sp. ZJ141]
MDAIVSARVPVAVKERGNATLKELGSTPSQLINAAYEFVLAERQLPKAREPLRAAGAQKRALTPQQVKKIRASLEAMYVGPTVSNQPFNEQLNKARDERYARFA